ncbi:putative acetyltransferase [Sphingomonas changbaiensis NBRC 104936]|uniref:Putative acetyltransferase n=1 Tax=Sphingomonas changbaiensis NBRC 104936 TaxID=1219043 RepID=A0A0E9MSM6_9SPHN|nr:GNAT family protein [Sphingomonas changbaiensis]GAO40473.1 putative acetyltransferase [Sphingomonas changbaiensis NBRC 104936]
MDLRGVRLEFGPVALEPIEERHREPLRAATNADRDVWDLYPYSMADPHFDGFWIGLRARQASGAALPFAVSLDGACVGISCYLNIETAQAACDIGGTYYRPDARGGVVNPAAKLLLLGHAFASGARRVAFKVDALNTRSRAAVSKLGAVQEGILRQDRVTWTGRVRDTVVFSVLRDEWPAVEAGLRDRLTPSPIGRGRLTPQA